MKGLALAKAYYDTYIDQLLDAVPRAKGRIAAGLVGEGSQCFGFDDALSQDHDFAPGFCIWLTDEDFAAFGEELQKAYDALPWEFQGYSRDNIIAKERLGVMTISSFYRRFTGSPTGIPENHIQWLFTPEPQLATATNGEIFLDELGQFSAIRQRLLQFYPEDIRRKKIAARAATMAQAGQYNLLRLIQRGDQVAALQAVGRFMESTLSMVYLLNRCYMPFYKWSFHGLQIGESNQMELAKDICPRLQQLVHSYNDYPQAFRLTEEICTLISKALNQQGLSQTTSPFLQDHLQEIMEGIEDPQIRSLPPMFDGHN